jgi:epoxyqueuosine reductase
MPLKPLLKQKALELGFDLVGIAPLGVWQDLEFARKWVEQGHGGEMHYLENPKRNDPRLVLPSAQSVLCVGLIYNAPFPYSTKVSAGSPTDEMKPESGPPVNLTGPRAWISRYAWGRDYHDIMRTKLEELRKAIEDLEPRVETRVYVDTGPIVERAFARYSGIGWTGKNTCLINPSKGSWFFLGVILTSLAIEPDLPAPDRCGSCTRCLDACPTGALTRPYMMDASRCIAYLNIELKGSIPKQYREKIGSNLFGCDICQDVCPWNRSQKPEVRSQNKAGRRQLSAISTQSACKGYGRAGAATTKLPEFQPMEINLLAPSCASHAETGRKTDPSPARHFSLFNPPLDVLTEVSEEDFRRAFAQSPVKRPKYTGWLRNLCVVMGNSGDPRFIPKLEELAHHGDAAVREHAAWALAQLARRRVEEKHE